jgi:hypothetical protein
VSILNLGVGLRSQAAPSIVPSMLTSAKQIDKLSLWFDASKITIAASQPVTQWNDLSGNNKHAVQATVANQPVFQNGGVYFDGTNDYLSFSAASAKTIIMAIKITKTGWSSIISQGYALDYAIRTSSSGSTFPAVGNTNDYAGSAGGTNIFIDGTQKTTYTTGNRFIGSFYQLTGDSRTMGALGAGYVADNIRFLGGEVYEIIGYDKVLTSKERKQVEKYLGRKWGVTIAP